MIEFTKDQLAQIDAILKRKNKVELRPKSSTGEVLIVEVETTVVEKVKID